MQIGVPKESKNNEYRVGMVPASVRELTHHGHRVFVETNAGAGIGCCDEEYKAAGAHILDSAEAIFGESELIVKVKEPQATERSMLQEEQVLFTYLHLAPDPDQADDLIESGATCIAYETVTDTQGRLPLLAPMSEVAGRMSIQAGAQALERSNQGRGILLGGVPGVEPANVVILGGGTVGTNASQMAVGLGAQVTVIDSNLDVLRRLDAQFGPMLTTVHANADAIERHVVEADLVIGGVLVPGDAAPKLISSEHIAAMKSGAAVVDVAIDQGGCIETSSPTTHDFPTYVIDNVVHYCVTNMPGAVPRTSAFALNNATLPYIIELAGKGYKRALADNPHLRNGLNIHKGQVTYKEVAKALVMPYVPALDALG